MYHLVLEYVHIHSEVKYFYSVTMRVEEKLWCKGLMWK